MKSYTDIEQSKKLAEILPLESADMWWVALNWQETEYYVEVKQDGISQPKKAVPCWSLSALLEQLENAAGLAKDYGLWFCYDNRKSYCTKHYNNPVDACYELILKLHELNLL